MSYAAGTYGGSATLTQFALSTGISASRGPWTGRATVPLYTQNNTVILTTGGGRVSGTGRRATSTAAGQGSGHGGIGGGTSESLTGYETGFGDPVLSLRWSAPFGAPYAAAATALAKVPLAGSSFSTGEWDAGLSLDVSRWLGRQVLSVGAAWWYVGDVPGYGLLSPWLGSVALSRGGVAGGVASVGAYVSSPTQDGLDPAVSGSVAYSRAIGAWSWIASLGAGFSDASPAFTASLGWRVGIGG